MTRPDASSITDDELDALYDRAEQAEQTSGIVLAAGRRAENAEAERDAAIARAEQAEARIVSLQAECDGLAEVGRNEERIWAHAAAAVRAVLDRYVGCASNEAALLRMEIRAALDGPAAGPAAP
jgi:hypothetical protein